MIPVAGLHTEKWMHGLPQPSVHAFEIGEVAASSNRDPQAVIVSCYKVAIHIKSKVHSIDKGLAVSS